MSMLKADETALLERRKRLSSLSWFMRCLCEPIARRANKEDVCSGRFWEGRFKCQKLLDEAAVLACSVYVDLNPIRAGLAKTPESSHHTSAHVRIATRTIRQVRRDKRGAISAELAPILDRLGLSDECWIDGVKNFGRWFHRVAGRVSALSDEATRAGKRWFQGAGRCGQAFT